MGSAYKGIVVSQKFKNYCQNSLSKIISAEIIDVIKVDTQQSLMNIRLRQTQKPIFQLGNTNELNPNEGQCVIDYLRYKIQPKLKKAVSEQTLVQFFGSDYVGGVTLEQISNYCKAFNFSLHVFNIFDDVIYRRFGNEFALLFFMHSNHAFSIINKIMIKSAVESEQFALSNYRFDIIYDDYSYYESGNLDEIVKVIVQKSIENKSDGTEFEANVIILDENVFDISDVMLKVSEKIDYQIIEQKCDTTNTIQQFRVPGSSVVVVGARQFEERKATYQHLMKVNPSYFVQFRNQSYAQIALEMYENLGDLNSSKSYLNDSVFEVIDQFTVSSYVATTENVVPQNYGRINLDQIKCYSNILTYDERDFYQFCVSDVVQVYDGREIIQGEFYIKKKVIVFDIKLEAGFYPYELVQKLLDEKVIERSDITQMLIPQKMIPGNQFREFVGYCYQGEKDCFEGEIPLGIGKKIVNYFTGLFGKRFKEQKQSAYVKTLEEACALFMDQEERGNCCNMYLVNDQFLVIATKREKLYQSHLQIYRQIISRGIIQLIDLAKTIKKELATEKYEVIITGFNTDSISFGYACGKDQLNKFKQGFNSNGQTALIDTTEIASLQKVVEKFGSVKLNFGGVKTEEYHTRGQEVLFDQIIEPGMKNKEWIIRNEKACLEDTVTDVIENPGLIIGIAGSGKTQIISKMKDKIEFQVLCFTNKACENLRQRRIVNVCTFDSYELSKLKFNGLVVDEVSMINSYRFQLIYQLKMQELKFGCLAISSNVLWWRIIPMTILIMKLQRRFAIIKL